MERFNLPVQHCHLWATNGIILKLIFSDESLAGENVSFYICSIRLNEGFAVIEDMNKSELGIVTHTQIRQLLCGQPSKLFSVTDTSGGNISLVFIWINKEIQDFEQIFQSSDSRKQIYNFIVYWKYGIWTKDNKNIVCHRTYSQISTTKNDSILFNNGLLTEHYKIVY